MWPKFLKSKNFRKKSRNIEIFLGRSKRPLLFFISADNRDDIAWSNFLSKNYFLSFFFEVSAKHKKKIRNYWRKKSFRNYWKNSIFLMRIWTSNLCIYNCKIRTSKIFSIEFLRFSKTKIFFYIFNFFFLKFLCKIFFRVGIRTHNLRILKNCTKPVFDVYQRKP